MEDQVREQIQPDDIKRLSNLEDAGIRGGIHSKRTYLMALHDGSLWIWKQTGNEERDEIFMYHLAQTMFRGIVPEVQAVYVPKLGWGSAMRKVAGIPAGRVDGLHGYFHGNEEMQADLVAMLVLDYLTGNPDRHSNNWFIQHNDRLAAIDNGWAGEDPVMTLSAVFEPANLAGLVRDESLWPKMLQMMLELINDLSGRGDEARALAQEIDINQKDAVAMVRLWEPKLQRLARFVQGEASKLQKERVYIKPGEQAPAGSQVEEGPRGGHYYESEPLLPGFEGVPPRQRYEEQPPAHPRTIADSAEDEKRQQDILEDAKERAIESAVEGKPELQGFTSASPAIRGAVKDTLIRDISIRSEVPYSRVAAYISSWASSSSDSNVESLALQIAAARLFSLPATDFIKESWGNMVGRMQGVSNIPSSGERLEEATKILKAMYDNTQEYLTENGIDSLVLYRGMRWFDNEGDNPTPDEFGYAMGDNLAGGFRRQEVEFQANPLSSWATRFGDARVFANFKPEGADEYEGELNWEDETFHEQAQSLLVEEAAAGGIDVEDDEAYEKWKDETLAEYDGSADMWAYQEMELYPPTLLPSMTRSISVVEVPREKIIATALTGLGCLSENEVVISGGEFNQTTYLADDYDGSNAFPLADSIEEMEIRYDEEKRFKAIYQEAVTAAEERAGQPLDQTQLTTLRQNARAEARRESEEPKRKPTVQEEPKTIAETEAGAKEIPEDVLAARLKALRNDPVMDVAAKRDKMVAVLFQWWTRKSAKWREATSEIYDDKSLSAGQRVEATAAIQIAQIHHSKDYKERLAVVNTLAGIPKDNPLNTDIDNQYDDAHLKLLEAVAAGTMDGDTYRKEQDKVYARLEAQRDVLGRGYDPNDSKLVGAQQRYTKAWAAVKAQNWGGDGEFNDFYKKQKAKEKRIKRRMERALAEAEPLKKMVY